MAENVKKFRFSPRFGEAKRDDRSGLSSTNQMSIEETYPYLFFALFLNKLLRLMDISCTRSSAPLTDFSFSAPNQA